MKSSAIAENGYLGPIGPQSEVHLSDRFPTLRRLLAWWPEAILAIITTSELAEDGLKSSAGDPAYYLKISEQVSQGMIPWRDFPFEYPPISLPPVLLRHFVGGLYPWPLLGERAAAADHRRRRGMAGQSRLDPRLADTSHIHVRRSRNLARPGRSMA